MDNLNLNQPPLPQIQNTNVYTDAPQSLDPRADLSGVSVLNPQAGADRSGILVLQNDIRTSAKGATALTTDLFSSLGDAPQKQRFESYTPYKSSDLYATLSSGERVARLENYIPGTDNNERLASQQTTAEKWANGATKFFTKTGNAVIGGTVGLVYGVGAAISDGSMSSIYDNSFSNTLADWDAKLSYQLPNLYTKQEQEKGLFGQMGTANFWSDKFLGGLSFTAGAIISEGIWAYATGGLSLATAGARLGARLGAKSLGRWGVGALGEAAALQGISKYKGFYKTMLEGTVQAGKISKTLPNTLGKAGELMSTTGILARSAGYEASVEALQFKREAEENFHQNFLSMNGREPNMDEIQEFQINLENSANAVFATNMAILMPSNLATMGHILGVKSPLKTGFNDFIEKKAFGYGIGKSTDDLGKTAYKALEATKGQKIARTAYNYAVKPSLTEGLFEEGLQGVTTKTANKWIEHSYNPEYTNSNLDIMGAFYESMGEQYGTKEGWVENGLGMLIGIVGGATNARGEMKQKADELTYQSAVATTFQTENLQSMLMPNRVQSANRMAGFSEEARVEAQKGNVSKSALAQKSGLLTFINAKMTLGEDISDIVREVKISLDSTSEDQWKAVGIGADQIDSHKEETLKDFEDLANDWKANKTYWGYMIGKKVVGEQELDGGVIASITGDRKGLSNTNAVIEALAWQSTIGETANKQMKEAQDAIARELGTEYANAVGLNSLLRAQSRETKQQINVATRSYKVELARRDALVAKIAKLNAAPKQPEAANRPAGKQAGVLTQALLESEQKLAALDAELQGYAENINKTSAYQKEIGEIDFTSQDLRTDLISGQDLVSLQENLAKFQTTLDTLDTTNYQRGEYLKELLKEYSDSEEVFLGSQKTQRAVLHPDFKIEQINSWVQGKVKKNASMNENTKEWFTDALQMYQKGKLASMSAQAEASLGEGIEERRQAIIAELDSIEDPESDRAKELQAELDSLEKPEEEVKIPEDKGEVKPKSRQQEIASEIAKLEAQRREELAALEDTTVGTTAMDYAQQIVSLIETSDISETIDNFTNTTLDREGKEKLLEDDIKDIVDNWGTDEQSVADYMKQQGTTLVKAVWRNNKKEFFELLDLWSKGKEEKGISQATTLDQNEQQKEAINDKYDAKIEALQKELTGKAPSQIEVLKRRISEALKGRHNYLTYLGDNYNDVANKKPTQAEVDEFIKLRDEKKFDDPRYQELQQKLSDWKLLDSAVDEEYESIGDLVLLVQQLEQEVAEEETFKAVTPEHVPDITDDESVQGSEKQTRYDILQNTNGAATFKRQTNGNLSLHHVKAATIAQRMGFDPAVDTLKNSNGKSILFGQEEAGAVMTVKGVEFKIVEGNAIEIKESDFTKEMQDTLNMYPLDTGSVSWSYSDIYTKVGDEFVKMESDFTADSGLTEDANRIYELKEGDKLTVTVNNEDGYNDKLLKEYNSAKEGEAKDKALKKLKDNLKLSVTTTSGIKESVSILKATRALVDEHFVRLRERAFERYMAAADKDNVNLGIELTVGGIFLGSPRFTIAEDGKIKNIPITARGTKEVLATGYILNGEIVTNREVLDINKTYIGKLSTKNANKKIPIVVFRKGNHNVAYPITVVQTPKDSTSLLDSIVAQRISPQEKVRKINEEIQRNNVDTPKLVYSDMNNQAKLDATWEAFRNLTTFTTADAFADKNYNMDNLVGDAEINVDLEDLGSSIADAKLRIKLDNSIKYKEDRDIKYENMIGVENELSDLARELYRDYYSNASTKYVDSKGNIIEKTGYTETFDDNPVEVPTSQLDKIKNINILREAFEGLTTPLEKIIGKETVNKAKDLFKQYDFLKSQVTPNTGNVKNGKNNSSC